MKVFQAVGLYRGYLGTRADALTQGYEAGREALLRDRVGAAHILVGEQEHDVRCEFINAEPLQKDWAARHGLAPETSSEDILLAQIEESRAEVFYCMEPVWLDSTFVRRLPGHVLASVAWRAAPLHGKDLSAYALIISNFPGLNQDYEALGLRSAYFFPAVDPVMQAYAEASSRSVDVLFVGGYTRHHMRRARVLERVAAELSDLTVRFHLDTTGAVSWAEHPLLGWAPLGHLRRPRPLRRVSRPPIFGLDLYEAIGQARVVLNGAIDMSGGDRGNIRCFETLGLGAAMVTDPGAYPEGMEDGRTLLTYADDADVVATLRRVLADEPRRAEMARAGFLMAHERYSKERQWAAFQALSI
jgi:hypothetical protein